jgi:hypothetical protein
MDYVWKKGVPLAAKELPQLVVDRGDGGMPAPADAAHQRAADLARQAAKVECHVLDELVW